MFVSLLGPEDAVTTLGSTISSQKMLQHLRHYLYKRLSTEGPLDFDP